MKVRSGQRPQVDWPLSSCGVCGLGWGGGGRTESRVHSGRSSPGLEDEPLAEMELESPLAKQGEGPGLHQELWAW